MTICRADLPYVDQYFGYWVMVEDHFRALADFARNVDLHVHLSSDAQANAQAAADRQRNYATTADGIAVVPLTGTLMKQVSSMGRGTSTVLARQAVRKAMQDPAVRAIVLKIDSPGGTVSGSSDLGDDIHAARNAKPTWAYIEDLGASGAYWQASQAEQIYANANALVGSIGTYGVVQDFSAQAEKLGVTVHVIRAGDHKGVGVPGAKITAEHIAALQREINELNDIFLKAVARGRGLDIAAVRKLADGTLHVGAKARDVGLIDNVGSFDSMLSDLRSSLSQGTSQMTAAAANAENARFVQEYNSCPAIQSQMSLDEYIATARLDEGVDEPPSWEQLFANRQASRQTAQQPAQPDAHAPENAPFVVEFREAEASYLRQGIDLAAYIKMRRIDEGLEPLV